MPVRIVKPPHERLIQLANMAEDAGYKFTLVVQRGAQTLDPTSRVKSGDLVRIERNGVRVGNTFLPHSEMSLAFTLPGMPRYGRVFEALPDGRIKIKMGGVILRPGE